MSLALEPYDLRCERLREPLGVDCPTPRLGWKLRGVGAPGLFEVEVLEDGASLWSTTAPGRATHVEYAGQALGSRRRYSWRVRVVDERGDVSQWAEGSWSMGLLTTDDWCASWIGAAQATSGRPTPALLRFSFELAQMPERAVVYASALGTYELWLNGVRADENRALAPEWTDYRQRVQYQTSDVTSLLRAGANTLGALLGDGWYAGRIGLADQAAAPEWGIYGIAPRLLVQLECEFSGGERRTIVSDEAWSATIAGPLRSADILDGSRWDARREDPHWCDRSGATVGWGGVAIGADLSPLLVSQLHEPIEPVAVLEPERMTSTGDSTVLDFGQNIAGWCELTASGEEGTPLRLRHAEALDAHGALYRDNLRIAVPGMPGAAQEDTFILRGDDGGERLAPRLTYHGFRFAEVSGRADLLSAQAVVARSAVEEILELTCSDPFVERLLDAVRRTLAGNLVGAPTDCPQRDERLGWSGDTQVIAPTLLALFDASAFLEKWCRDLRDAQTPEGCFPDFAPHPFGPLEPPKSEFYGNPGWADAGVIVPWRIYEATGEPRVLRDAFDSACRWVDYVHARNPTRLWLNRPHAEYGDWLNGDTLVLEGWPREGCAVPKPVYATAFFHRSTSLVASMAEVLGDDAQQRRYAERADAIRRAFIDAYVTEDGTVLGDTQGGYALALAFGLVPDELESAVLERLVAAVRARGTRLTTGIQTTPLLLRELTRRGEVELAYELVFARTIPSWGYMLEQGATTVWERWDAFVPGRGFQNPRMNSLNHFALGAVGEWIVRTIGGIARAAPGYERVVIEPCPGGGVTAATCRLRSERGPIEVAWALEDGSLRLVAELPPGVGGAVRLRTSNGNELLYREIGPGRHSFAVPA